MKVKKMKLSWILLIVLVLILVLSISQIGDKKQNIPKCINCNIIFIDIDSLRADHLGVYGYYKNTSPNIDAFAMKSILFKNTFSQGHWTPLSVKSLLISSLPTFWKKRVEQNASLPQILKKENYITAAFIGYPFFELNLLGFDNFKSYDFNEFSFNKIFDDGLDFIGRNSNKKFFLYLHGYDLHYPTGDGQGYYSNLYYNETVTHLYDLYFNKSDFMINNRNYSFKNLRNSLFKPEQIRAIIEYYDNRLLSFDESFGYFIYKLNKTGLLNKTIIVIFSNHGDDLFENWRIGHQFPSYYTLHVPLIIYIPNLESKIIDRPVALIDIMPTILSLTNTTTNVSMQGINLVKLIENKNLIEKSRIIHGALYTKKGNWILFFVPEYGLYDIEYDINESNNLADNNQDIVKELMYEHSDFVIRGMKIR